MRLVFEKKTYFFQTMFILEKKKLFLKIAFILPLKVV